MENLKKPTVPSPSDNSSEAGVQIYPLDEEEIAEEKKQQDFPENDEENLTAEIMIEPIETTMATDLEEEEPKNNITMEVEEEEDIDVKPATIIETPAAVAAAIVPAVTSSRTYKRKRCPRGSRRSRITHHCRKYRVTKKLKRCRKGHRRNKKTRRCRKIRIKK